MKLFTTLLLLVPTLLASAAGVKISDLALSTAPSTNTFLEIADLNATGTNKSAKVLYTNLFMRAGLWTNAAGVVSLNNLTANGTLKLTADDGAGQGVIDLWTAGTKRWTLSGGGILYPLSNYDLGTTVNPVQAGYFSSLGVQLADRKITSGTGSPEGVRTAEVSSLYLQTDGAAGTTLWTKTTGSGNTGWTAVGVGGTTGLANPTASIGLTAVNGSATTAMRSDAAPALASVGTPGTYTSVTTDAAGRVTAGSNPAVTSAANWTAVGTTNSSLAGVATVNGLVVTNGITVASPIKQGASGNLDLWAGSSAGVRIMKSDGTLSAAFTPATDSLTFGSAADTQILRDGAANTLALRNGANAQNFHIYNTYTDASNYERGFLKWESNFLQVGTSQTGTGAARALAFIVGNSARWQINTSGHLLAQADNTYDIGASGATRPRTLYLGNQLVTPYITVDGNGAALAVNTDFYWAGRSHIASASDGIIKFVNNANTDFNRLQFGGTTASFPAIKRNAAAINFRLADDSSDAAITAADITSSDTIAFTAKSRIRGSITDGNIRLSNAAVNDFGLLQFGGTSSSFPAVKRSGTQLQARLADDSDFTGIAANQIQSGVVKVLTDAAATSAFYIAVANTNTASGHVVYTVSATDGTDTQAISGDVKFASVGKATAVTAQIADVQTTAAVSAGTLSCTVTANVSTNNVLALQWNADTSLTTTNLVLRWRLETPSTYTVNPL